MRSIVIVSRCIEMISSRRVVRIAIAQRTLSSAAGAATPATTAAPRALMDQKNKVERYRQVKQIDRKC